MPKRLLVYSRTQPARTVVAITAWLTFLSSIFIFTPWFVPLATTPAVSAAFQWPVYLGGVLNFLACIPAIVAVKRNDTKALSIGAFWLFIWYSFVTLTRIITGAAFNLTWITTLIIALIMAVVYIEQAAQTRRYDE